MKQLEVCPNLEGNMGVGWMRDDAPLFHMFAVAAPGALFQPSNGRGGPHWPCSVCEAHGYTEADFHEQMTKLSVSAKADYVRAQEQTREHTCHWPGCGAQVPPAMWGCKTHWMRLPRHLRNRIWRAYRPGQEQDMQPSKAYLVAADAVQKWIQENAE